MWRFENVDHVINDYIDDYCAIEPKKRYGVIWITFEILDTLSFGMSTFSSLMSGSPVYELIYGTFMYVAFDWILFTYELYYDFFVSTENLVKQLFFDIYWGFY